MKAKEKKKLKKYGDSNSMWALAFMSDGKSKLEMAVALKKTLPEIEDICTCSLKFRRAIELGVQKNLSEDLKILHKKMKKGKASPTETKILFGEYYKVDDKVIVSEDLDKNEDFGFDITVRKK